MSAPREVLLVEDNEGDIELTQRAFEKNAPFCRLSVVNDGLEALDFLRQRGKFISASLPDLILLDLNMPRIDGKKFLEAVKGDSKTKAIPVVILTSSGAPTDIKECYE